MTIGSPRVRTGADRLLAHTARLRGRRYGLLAHGASVTADLCPLHLALAAAGAPSPRVLFGPEHGYFGVEQDMVPSHDARDPFTGVPIRSLYGEEVASFRPRPGVFDGLDLLVIDLQDIGSRYYTYAATAVWAAEAALAAGLDVWVLDRPNPLGGEQIEGNLLEPGFESFVGAFLMPVRHGLTLGELVRLEGRRRGWDVARLEIVAMAGWRRSMLWPETGLPWIAPSPNMPTAQTALIYPGGCLFEATVLSEGRGTTRPFHLIGAPEVDPVRLVEVVQAREPRGIAMIPTFFKPQFQKHAGRVCGGVELVVTDGRRFAPYRFGLLLLEGFRQASPATFGWRTEPYELVDDVPAIDLLTGSDRFRKAFEAGEEASDWLASWGREEGRFRSERAEILLYPEARE